jgi:hypothetical protein
MRGLTPIGSARLDLIFRSCRNVERLLLIPIEIPDKQTICPVGILKPAFIRSGNALSGIVRWFEGKLLGENKRNKSGTKENKKRKIVPFVFSCASCVLLHLLLGGLSFRLPLRNLGL